MKKLALGALFAAACGGGDKTPQLVDASTDGSFASCDPIAQTGCNPNEKCTWIIDQLSPEIGHIGCAPVTGSEEAVGGPCLDAGDPGGPPAGPNGYDNCEAGAVCVARICKTICDPQAAGTASGCSENFTCGRYIGLLEASGASVAGACDSNCNILDQTQHDGAAACGSADPTAPNQGCYANPFFKRAADGTTGSCAPVRSDTTVPTNPQDQQNLDMIKHLDRTDRVKPLINPANGNTFKNSCAPGFMPIYFENDTSMKTLCTGICAPNPAGINSDIVANGNNDLQFGDPTAVVKLPRKAAAEAGDGVCQLQKKGNALEPENCVFLWGIFLQQDGTINPMLGPEGEEFGLCFPFASFSYDSNNDGTEDTNFPNFANLPPRSGATPGTFPANFDDACDFVGNGAACLRSEANLFQPLAVPQKQMLRLGDLDAPALRR